MNQSTPVSLPDFTWPPLLQPNNIRLIQLAGSNDKTAPLQLTLLQAPLPLAPKYFAISYAWQGQRPSRSIPINGHSLLVTRNCEAALLRFRPLDRGQKVMLWIDAVCIDQSLGAIGERNQQVSMMGEIFGGAEQVWVWLGSRAVDGLDERFERVLRWFGELDKAVSSKLDFERVRKVRKLAGEVDLNGE
jgi:hypothetical protein